jgi:hypothetical protein
MKFTDHIELSDWSGQCLLTVRDAELHDFLDEFFVEHGMETQIVRPPNNPGHYQLLFPAATSIATVHRLLAQVGPEEIDRIVRLNHDESDVSGGA